VRLTAQASNSQSLAWDAVSGATSYDIQRSTNGGAFSTIASGVTATTYDDSTATLASGYSADYSPGQPPNRYVYGIRATNGGGSSAWSTDIYYSIYRNGVRGWTFYELSYNNANPGGGLEGINYSYSFTGPDGNPTVLRLAGDGFQPASSGNTLFTHMAINWANYLRMKVYPTGSGFALNILPVSVGDLFYTGPINIVSYVTAPTPGVWTANTWNTVVISIFDLLYHDATATASFSGTDMIVTAASGIVRHGMVVGGSGVALNTQINEPGASGGADTYTMTTTQTLSSRSVYISGTDVYKMAFDVPAGAFVYYLDDIRYSRE
jgi:hypothetical protein